MTPTGRRLYDVPLEVVQGSRFQPTGFPDIGPAEFERPTANGSRQSALLVESTQSMANRLEAQGWDVGRDQPVEALDGLPHVRVTADDDGRYLTSSRTEPHRLASAWIKNSVLDGKPMKDVIRERLDLRADTPLSAQGIATALMKLDPLCLVHGVFFAEDKDVWPGQPKVSRAITGFVEAADVSSVTSGGVKRDHVQHRNTPGRGAKEGYGSVPFHRVEYTAASITAYFAIDLQQLRGYGLGDTATTLLDTVAQWEIASLLENGLRLRTACDLMPRENEVRGRAGELLPPAEELANQVRQLIDQCGDLLGDGAPIDVQWNG